MLTTTPTILDQISAEKTKISERLARLDTDRAAVATRLTQRTFAWLNRNRRLAKDFEGSIASAKAWVYIASVQLLIRRLA
jgi:hypothetical protein